MIQCDKMIEHRKPDIVLVDKVQQKCLIIDVACQIMKNIDIIPIIVGALGSITTELG